jgi:hemoglobin-like flavoprotein
MGRIATRPDPRAAAGVRIMDKSTLDLFDASLRRCNARPGFLDLFYENFLASSPKVEEKFANTDFVRQKRALRASLHLMLLAAGDGDKGPERYLKDLAARHSRSQLNIGAELYDLWLDSLLATVKECDPQFDPRVEAAWENVMTVGIGYMLSHFQ